MKQRPWPIVLLALFHVIAPLGNIVVNAWLAHIPLAYYLHILLAPGNRSTLFVFTLVPLIGAVLIYICRKWSYVAYIILMTIPFAYSLISYMRHTTLMMTVALILFYFVNIMVVGYFLLPTVRKIYFDPRMRWWETKPRYQTDFQCHVEHEGKQHWVEIKNISEGGVFLETPLEFPLGSPLKLFFRDPQGVLNLSGTIVYKRQLAPLGYGFKFTPESSKEPRLKGLIHKLQSDGAIVLGRVPGPEDSFVYWVRSLFSFRK